MAAELEPLRSWQPIPDDCRPDRVESLGSAGGFSGAPFWRVESRFGVALPTVLADGPPLGRAAEFIQAVLWHVVREGFELVPLPLSHAGNTRDTFATGAISGNWPPGCRERPTSPSNPTRRRSSTRRWWPWPSFTGPPRHSRCPIRPAAHRPGIRDRRPQLQTWISGDLERSPTRSSRAYGPISRIVRPGDPPARPAAAEGVLELADQRFRRHRVALQPCIRDVWHDHVLFEEDRVSGLIDFGSMAAG